METTYVILNNIVATLRFFIKKKRFFYLVLTVWVLVAGLSLVVVSRGYSLVAVQGLLIA